MATNKQNGIVMVEVLISILLFSLGVLALVGLQASLLRNTTDAKYRAEASYLVQKRLGEMWADPAGLAAGNYTTTMSVGNFLPNGEMTVVSPTVGIYTITVTWMLPGETYPHNVTVTASVAGNS